MKKITEILWRLIKVIYILFLLLGLLIGLFTFLINSPSSYQTYSYEVTCDNGKIFDPTSKPIDKTSYIDPYSFDDQQLRSECECGNAWWCSDQYQIPSNYKLTYQTYSHAVGSLGNQVGYTIIVIIAYYVVLEVIRRTILYIFFGRNFINLKRK
jgi:hypothetical protein